ncbi:MAG TPA: ABC transporter permease, partial [Opitutaceae bacterium]|nr:ABC transporter permease [Opitutaceae bacterium]
TAVAVMTLGLGIASPTVIFSAIKTVLFEPLPMAKDQDRLLHMTETAPARGHMDMGMSPDDFADLRRQMTTVEGMWTYADRTMIITNSRAEPERLMGTDISAGTFSLLGIKPHLGRDFVASDFGYSAPEVAILSYGLWQRRFGSDPTLIDSTVMLNDRPTVIIGVMPKAFAYPSRTEIWLPQRRDPAKEMRGSYSESGFAKLKKNVTLAQAQAEADVIMAGLAKEYPRTNDGIYLRFKPLTEHAAGDAKHLMILLFGAVLFVFLIACLNVANLLLARAGSRNREFALRLALGASRARLVRQLLTESLLLAVLGGICGLIGSLWGAEAVLALIPVEVPYWLRFDLDVKVLGFVLGLSFLAAITFGLTPALRATRLNLIEEIKEGGRTGPLASVRSSRLNRLLVISEIALALVLLVGAGLMMRTFSQLRKIEPGFDARHVSTFRVGLPPAMAPEPAQAEKFFSALIPRLQAIPGVEAAAAVSVLPGNDGDMTILLHEHMPEPARYSEALIAHRRAVSPTYFSTMKIPLIAGRSFSDHDLPDSPPVVVVDEAFARTHFQSVENALGKRVKMYIKSTGTTSSMSRVEIVGIVGSVRHRIDRDEPKPTVYCVFTQVPQNFMSLVLRSSERTSDLFAQTQSAVLATNRSIPIYYPAPLETVVLQTVWTRQFFSYLFSGFAAIALFLACDESR